MIGIILAGGSGSRLSPSTDAVSKQLLPVFDKPLIYYPLGTLLKSGIKEVIIISTKNDVQNFRKLLKSGDSLGINIHYVIQNEPNGIAEAFLLSEDYIKGQKTTLILGDNIFYGEKFEKNLCNLSNMSKGAQVFAKPVTDPERFGIVELASGNKAISIEEKPKQPKSNLAVTGLYFYDEKVLEYAKAIKPSARGELEITDINKIYMENNELNVIVMSDDDSWFDAGTHESLLESSASIRDQVLRGRSIGYIEKDSFDQNFISKQFILDSISKKKSSYFYRLKQFLNESSKKS